MSQSIPLEHKRHSLAHLLAAAVQELYPNAELGIGPVIENGFYYDFLLAEPLTPEILSNLEDRMRKLIAADLPFTREDLTPAAAKDLFSSAGQKLKVELISDIEKFGTTKASEILGETDTNGDTENTAETVSIYRTGNFFDLCRGGHVEHTGQIDPLSFKLHKISGAYWRGKSENAQMQRVYGLAFDTAAELQGYEELQAELEKRDHRILGPKLGLFSFHEYAPGIPFYLPKGAIVRQELEKFVREVSYGEGYSEVRLPQLFHQKLFETSGHWDFYKDDMFTLESEGETFALKPMNCPGHMLMFDQGLYSYRDLPLRLAEMTTLYRNELSGTLNGLTRVRAFAQDDCHIFLAPDQIADEVAQLLGRIQAIYGMFNMTIEDVMLSTKPEAALGTAEEWEIAEAGLAAALDKAGIKYKDNPGDGAFYGPKIDMQIRDVLGRKWQLATVQLDFQLPKRFNLGYITPDGSKATPVVIHRAIMGSYERFMAILIEQFDGAFPVWLAPEQAVILPISEKFTEYATQVKHDILTHFPTARLQIDDRSESIGKRIREQTMQKVPYILVVGEKEITDGTVAVRTRSGAEIGVIPVAQMAERLKVEAQNRADIV